MLSQSQLAQVEDAVDQLYNERRVRLWVVYVDSFDQDPVGWARVTMQISNFGDYDALLAVATDERSYAFQVPSDVASQSEASALQRNEIEPQLRQGDWAGAAVAAANGLNEPATSTSPSSRNSGVTWLGFLIAMSVLGLVVLALYLLVAAAAPQAARSRVRRGQASGPRRPQRVGRRPDRCPRRSLQDDGGRRRQRNTDQRQRIGLGGRRIRLCPDRTLQPRGQQRQDDAGAGIQRPPDPRRRRPRDAAAAPRPAHPRGGRRRQGRPGTGRAIGGFRQTARSRHQRAHPTGRDDPADGRPHRPARPIGAGAGRSAQPIRCRRTDFGRRQCEDRQAAVGFRRSEHQHRADTGRPTGGPADGSGRCDPRRRILAGTGAFATGCRRQRGRRHQSRRRGTSRCHHRHPERCQPGQRGIAAGQDHPSQ